MSQPCLVKMFTCTQDISKHSGPIAMKFTELIHAPERISPLHFSFYVVPATGQKCYLWIQDDIIIKQI